MTFAPQSMRKQRIEVSLSPSSSPIRLLPVAANVKEPQGRRHKLWDLSPSLHCSIIGACFSMHELRRTLAKVCGDRIAGQSDHEIHKVGVSLASNVAMGAKLLHKALDGRYETALKRFGRARTSDELRELWNEYRGRGDIPGAYWAILTSAIAGEDLARDAFGDVHMLSHLVGAANRADVRRLAVLEDENAGLTSKVQKQQDQLHAVHAEFKREVAQLRALLAQEQADDGGAAEPDVEQCADERVELQRQAARLQRQLAKESARAGRLEQMRQDLRVERDGMQTRLAHAERDLEQKDATIRNLECFAARGLAARSVPGDGALAHKRLLFVGGRTHSVPQFEAVAERYGAELLHHDGGQQESSALLPALVARADMVFFPVDCISHDAALAVKHLCKRLEKSFAPLASSGLGAFILALEEHARRAGATP